jgi:hypothetical protein
MRIVIEDAEQPTVYRFIGGDRTYGPRALDWVVKTYGSNGDVSAAPEQSASVQSSWKPISDWAAALPSAPSSQTQRARLEQLGAGVSAALSYAEAARAVDEAEAAKRTERGRRSPTSLKLRRLAALGISAPQNASRVEVDRLLRQHELALKASELVVAGLSLPPEGVTDDNLYALEDAVEALRFALAQATERGLAFEPPYPLSAEAMSELAELIERVWSIAGDLPGIWSDLVDSGDLPRIPTDVQRRAVLGEILTAMSSGQWTDSDGSYIAIGLKALGR